MQLDVRKSNNNNKQNKNKQVFLENAPKGTHIEINPAFAFRENF